MFDLTTAVATTGGDRRTAIAIGHTWKYCISTASLIGIAYFRHCENPPRAAARYLDDQCRRGLLGKRRILVRPTPHLSAPCFVSVPGEPPPDANVLCYQLEKRWSKPLRQTTVYFATKRAARKYGGHSRGLKSAHHASHDLLCTAVYLHLERTDRKAADEWLIEDLYLHTLPRYEKPGDARLIGPDGPYVQHEILGRYSRDHLRNLSRCSIPYVLW